MPKLPKRRGRPPKVAAAAEAVPAIMDGVNVHAVTNYCRHGPPAMPWLAAAIEPTPEVLSDPERQDIYLAAGDLERVVAWALLE